MTKPNIILAVAAPPRTSLTNQALGRLSLNTRMREFGTGSNDYKKRLEGKQTMKSIGSHASRLATSLAPLSPSSAQLLRAAGFSLLEVLGIFPPHVQTI